MKLPIMWHERALENYTQSLIEAQKNIHRRMHAFEVMQMEYTFGMKQLAEAKKRGLLAYDPDKLLVPRVKRAT